VKTLNDSTLFDKLHELHLSFSNALDSNADNKSYISALCLKKSAESDKLPQSTEFL
jgi:hypothetical protein